jgi:hypothetical protein
MSIVKVEAQIPSPGRRTIRRTDGAAPRVEAA